MRQNCIIVNRVSSLEQEEKGFSLDAQERYGKAYAKSKDFDVLKVFTFQESASKTRVQNKFNEVMSFIALNSISGKPLNVIVEKPDRWGRLHSRKERLHALILERLVVLHYYKENKRIDHTCSPHDIFVDDIMTSVNKYTALNIGREAMKGMREKAKQGWFPGKPPVGYKNNLDKTSSEAIIIVPDEAEFVKRVYELRGNNNLSYQSIVNKMKQEHNIPHRLRSNFYKSKVEYILKNSFYEGSFYLKDLKFQGRHEVFIDRSLLQKVNESFQQSGNSVMKKHKGLFSDYLRCGECGCKVTYQPKTKKSGLRYELYACANGKKEHETLKGRYAKEEDILKQFEDVLEGVSISEEVAGNGL